MAERIFNEFTQRYQGKQSPAVTPGKISCWLKGEEKNRNKWKIGKVTKLIKGNDGVVRGAKLQSGKDTIERPIQLIYPLELQCDERKSKIETS